MRGLMRAILCCAWTVSIIACGDSGGSNTPVAGTVVGGAAGTGGGGAGAGTAGTGSGAGGVNAGTPPAGGIGGGGATAGAGAGNVAGAGAGNVAGAGAGNVAGAGAGAGGAGAGTGAGMGAGTGGPPPAGTWPMMGYDERNWYFNPTETTLSVANAATLTEKWRFEVVGFPPGTPVIAEDKVFVMASAGTFAIDLATGTDAWTTQRTDLMGTASVAYADGFVYVHGYDPPELYKLNASDGTTVWGPILTYDLAGCDGMSSPIVAGDKVMVGHCCGNIEVGAGAGYGMAKGGVEAFNIADGSHAWTYWTVDPAGEEDGAMVWSSVGADVASGTVFATTGNNYSVGGGNSDSIHAFNLADGTKQWSTQVRADDTWSLMVAILGPDTDFGANPIVTDNLVAAGDKGSAFWALDKASGTIMWDRQGLSPARNMARGGVLMAGAYDGTRFYTVANDSGAGTSILHGMDNGPTGGWTKDLPKVAMAGPSVANGVLVVPNDDDLYILDASTGNDLAMFNTGGTSAGGAAAIANGMVVVGSGLQYPYESTAKDNNLIIAYGLP